MGAFKRNSAGISRILKSDDVRRMVDSAAEKIAAEIHASDPDIEPGVNSYTTDRAAASVVIIQGRARQARDGVFSRAAAAHGIEVVDR